MKLKSSQYTFCWTIILYIWQMVMLRIWISWMLFVRDRCLGDKNLDVLDQILEPSYSRTFSVVIVSASGQNIRSRDSFWQIKCKVSLFPAKEFCLKSWFFGNLRVESFPLMPNWRLEPKLLSSSICQQANSATFRVKGTTVTKLFREHLMTFKANGNQHLEILWNVQSGSTS